MKKLTLVAAACFAFMLSAVSFSSMALTPDGSTPANEGICEEVQGATRGLYGLCVAYCEAQDLDSIERPPNTKILDNYRKKMQSGDPDMPCVQTSCPCWTETELSSIISDGSAANCATNTVSLTDTTVVSKIIYNDTSETQFATGDTKRSRCGYVDLNSSPVIKIIGLSITPAQAELCLEEVTQACTYAGFE